MEEHPGAAVRRRSTFASLAYPNYRLWFFGQMTSLFGTWMQSTAQGYLVYELTRSEAYLGYVGFASGIATWLFTLFGGVVAPWHIICLAFSLGVVNAFDAPARQSFILEMVERPSLTNAIALNSTMFNTATAIGPAMGGLTYALLGPGWCFAINGFSFVAVIGALLAMRLPAWTPRRTGGSALADIREGLRVVASDRRILAVIGLLAGLSLFGMSFATLLPAWAVQVLGGDARTNGFLQSARGLGALSAALGIASLSDRRLKGTIMTAAALALPVSLVLFSLTRSLAFSLVALLVVGAANITVVNLANSLVQGLVPDEVRGRVMGVYLLAFFGFMPIGALLAGAIASAAGTPLTVALSALGFLACASLVTLLVPSLRRLA